MRTKDCCGCYSLRGGSLTIGVCFLVVYGAAAVAFAGVMIWRATLHMPPMETIYPALYFTAHLCHLVFNSLLVHGVRTDAAGPMHAWIIYHRIVLGVMSAGVAIVFIFACIKQTTLLLVVTLAALPVIGVLWYCYVVVHSHYEQLLPGAVAISALKRSTGSSANL